MEFKIKNKYYQFLDELCESGYPNMWAASPLLKDEFPELTDDAAVTVLLRWSTGEYEKAMCRKLEADGRIEIPEPICKKLEIKPGDKLFFRLEQGCLCIEKY